MLPQLLPPGEHMLLTKPANKNILVLSLYCPFYLILLPEVLPDGLHPVLDFSHVCGIREAAVATPVLTSSVTGLTSRGISGQITSLVWIAGLVGSSSGVNHGDTRTLLTLSDDRGPLEGVTHCVDCPVVYFVTKQL